MINLAVYNTEGKEIETINIDEAVLGGSIRYPLLKQAIVMYQANRRVGTAVTKGRSMVAGSGHKLFRQKGTGNARVGNRRTGKRVGGGVTFAKVSRDFSQRMPKKQRRLARDSAILAKLLGDNVVVVDQLNFEKPKTSGFVDILSNLKIDRSCLVAIGQLNENVYKSARNVQKVEVVPVSDLNAGLICKYQKILVTKDALLYILNENQDSDN